jgi:hypothetical protein
MLSLNSTPLQKEGHPTTELQNKPTEQKLCSKAAHESSVHESLHMLLPLITSGKCCVG